MATNLYTASEQWASRPADERYWTLEEMHAAAEGFKQSAGTKTVVTHTMRAEYDSTARNMVVVGPGGHSATLTNYGFGQLAGRIGAPAGYLRELPGELAAQNLNYGLQDKSDEDRSTILFHQNGSLVARCFTSEVYSRIWNADVTARLLPLSDQGWRVPPARPVNGSQPGARPATEADVLRSGEGGGGLSVNVGDMIAPAGLYLSDHDMFAFLVNEERRIDDGSEGGLSRGFFISNSEVGAAALKITSFLYRHVCGNHICWDVSQVKSARIIHRGRRGSADWKFRNELRHAVAAMNNRAASEDEAIINAARNRKLGDSREEVIATLFRRQVLPKMTLEAAYDAAETQCAETRAGSPRNVWGFVQGITRVSQETTYADRRAEIDAAAGKVLALAM